MSLINDALKKAARQRAEEQADVMAPMPGGGRRPSRQGAPMRTQSMVLIGAAALVLGVVSAVVTGIYMTGKPAAKPVAEASPPPQAAPAQAPAASPIVVQAPAVAVVLPQQNAPAPVAAQVAPAVSYTPAAAVHVAPAVPSPTPPPAVVQAPAPAAVVPVAAAQAPAQAAPAASVAAAPQSHADLVQGVVDGYHISGVRLAGAGSKALIDGHVYKLNDFVDKTLGLKLAKVDEDHLTFVDRDGNTFAKTF